MGELTVLIPIAVAMGLLALAGFFWALRAGQYEDLEGASASLRTTIALTGTILQGTEAEDLYAAVAGH